ncbi:MAG: TMEM175 family protein [Polyangiaceae bacterium]|nr:TMEM175 family protein [Polyangiaceae bacterium]
MSKSRLEAFTDGVIAIIITILVLDLKSPASADMSALLKMVHPFLVYVVSFATLAVYWNNHHHIFQAARGVSGKILWWNILLLFCISLFPLTTSWVGQQLHSRVAQMTYGALMLAANVVWAFLTRALLKEHSKDSMLARALAGSRKSAFTIAIIVVGLFAGWFWPPAVILSCSISLVPWVVPDRRIEEHLRLSESVNENETWRGR